MDLIKALNEQYMKPELPDINVGDTVRVSIKVKEGNRERIQAFEGTVIARKHGGISETITVRRISYNVALRSSSPSTHQYCLNHTSDEVRLDAPSCIISEIGSARRRRSRKYSKGGYAPFFINKQSRILPKVMMVIFI